MTRDYALGEREFRGARGWNFVQRTGKQGAGTDAAPDAVVLLALARARGKPTRVVPRVNTHSRCGKTP